MSGQICYSDEFKIDAVAQVTQRGYSVKEVSGRSFRGQYLNYETFERVRFVDCDFSHVDAKLASFRECEFVDWKFGNGNYKLATFSGCSFFSMMGVIEIRNASFRGARFSCCKVFTNCAIYKKISNAVTVRNMNQPRASNARETVA